MDLMDRGNLAAAIRQGAFLEATGEGLRPVSGLRRGFTVNSVSWLDAHPGRLSFELYLHPQSSNMGMGTGMGHQDGPLAG
jgi:hypothetical protein